MIQPRRVNAKLFLVSIALGAAILLFDLSLPLGVAGGVPYVALVLIGLWTPGWRYVLSLAAIATALIVLGYFYSPSGSVAWVALANRTLAVFAIWITALLIAYRKQAEEALRENEERFRTVLDHSPTKIHIKDLEGRYVLVNKGAEELFGVTDEDARGRTSAEIFPKERAEAVAAHDRAVIEAGRAIEEEEEWVREDGVHTYLTVKFPIRDASGKTIAVGAIGTNITERKRAEAALQESEEWLRTTLTNIVEGVVAINDDGIIQSLNPAAERMFGYSAEEIIGRSVDVLMPERERSKHADAIRRHLETGRAWVSGRTREVRGRRKDGTAFPLDIGVAEMRLGERRYFVSTLRDITERKATEDALRESEARLRTITEASPVPLVITRRSDGKILYANPRVGPALGLAADEVIGRSMMEFYGDPSEREERLAALDKAGYIRDIEVEMRKADGSPISTIHSLQVIEYQGEQAVLGGFYDITERKRAEEALRESRDHVRLITNNLPAGISYFDSEQRYRFVNRTLEEWYDRPAEEILGRTIGDILGKEVQDRISPSVDATLKGKVQNYEHVVTYPDGKTRAVYVEYVPHIDGTKKLQGYFALVHDITERKRAEEAQRESKLNLVKAQQLAKIGNWRWSIERNELSFFSEEYAHIHGVAPEEIRDHMKLQMERVIHPEDRDRVSEVFRKVDDEGLDYEIEYRIICPNGDERHVLEIGETVSDATGRAVEHVGTLQDITERKAAEAERERLETQLRQAQKMEALGVLAGGIAHEINNMVFAIVGLAESVRKSLPKGSEDRAALDGVLEAGERCRDLVQQILAFSRHDEPQICVIDLSSVIGRAHRLVRAMLPATIELRWDLDEACGSVLADPTQIHQLLLNLASNAADAMTDEKGALLEISLDQVELDDDRTSRPAELGPGSYARLTARDNGCGMDGDILDRIFDPFFTTKAVGRGTGMGLAAVHGIVTGLGGAIAVSSEVGRGTRFEIYLPLVDEREAGRHAQAARSLAASA